MPDFFFIKLPFNETNDIKRSPSLSLFDVDYPQGILYY